MRPDEDDGLVRVMSGGGLFIEVVPPEAFECETRVISEIELWSLMFECGLQPPPSADGVAGLRTAELTALLDSSPSSPTANLAASHVLAPYLLDTPGLSPGAYNEWLTRVCEQPDD